jgi:hypothetical protein
MSANLLTTWTPILKALPERERERARELIDKYGENYPTHFIIELLELFGIHTAYLQSVPKQVTAAAEQARIEIEKSVEAATALQERTRSGLGSIVPTIVRTGEDFAKSLEAATAAQVRAVESSAADIKAKIGQEFEKQNLPALTACLKNIQEQSAKSAKEAERIQREAERIQKQAEERLRASEQRCAESITRIEGLNWKGAWAVCSFISLAVLIISGVAMYEYFRSRSEAILARKIVAATATIEQNRDAFQQLAIADIALKVNRSSDARTGKAVPSGFAIIVENALVAEMRDYGNGKAAFIFLNGFTPEEQIHRLQVRIEKLVQEIEAARK